jgi:hypothetical protein
MIPFQGMIQCSLQDVYHYFGGTFYLHLHISQVVLILHAIYTFSTDFYSELHSRVTVLLRNQEVWVKIPALRSTILTEVFLDFLIPSKEMPRQNLKLGDDRFLRHPFKFISQFLFSS